MIYWMLAREVKILRGQLSKDQEWDEMVDLFYYRTLEDKNATENKTEEQPVAGGEPEETENKDEPKEN